ncbi:MAG: GNAT family N-acetyltransferase, partial [Propionicimonas sp.]
AYVSEARLYGDLDLPPLRETLAEVEAQLQDPEVIVLGLRRAGRLVGSVRVRLRGATAELGRLVVAPDLQGRGLGTRLLAAAEGELPPVVDRLELFTGELSLANLRLYQRLGYREFARRPAGSYDLVFLARTLARTAP